MTTTLSTIDQYLASTIQQLTEAREMLTPDRMAALDPDRYQNVVSVVKALDNRADALIAMIDPVDGFMVNVRAEICTSNAIDSRRIVGSN